jgi:hypothetical protein
VEVTAVSGDIDVMESTTYTAVVTREGLFEIQVPGDGEGKVRVYRKGDDRNKTPVENTRPDTELTMEVTPGLGYVINSIEMKQTGDTADDSAVHTVTPGGPWAYDSGSSIVPVPGGDGLTSNTHESVIFNFKMPARAVQFTPEFGGIPGVGGVAYVAEDGWNDLGYGATYPGPDGNNRQAAVSWGTASKDLQAVIDSWDGSNFTEIWVKGTVTPKSWANTAVGAYTIGDTGNNSDKAFVIPPGLKIYGGFDGTESAGSGSGQFPGPISANLANDKRNKPLPDDDQDWRLRTVLSGALTGTTNAYHVVIMADMPDTNPAVLDGLTISGGMGANSPGTLSVKTGYDINKQSGAGIYLVNASPVLHDVRVQGNQAQVQGGGIYNLATGNGQKSNPRLTDTVIYNNSVLGSGNGGGMCSSAITDGSTASPELDGVTIKQNQTSGGGGGFFMNNPSPNATSKPVITNSKILRNAAAYGAGVYIHDYTAPEFTNVVILGNTGGAEGGGVLAQITSRPVFTNVTIAGNTAGQGAGVDNRSYYLVMTNATISGNVAYNMGGGFRNYYSSGAVLTNVLLENNKAKEGGAIATLLNSNGTTENRDVLIITNGIIRGNQAVSYGGGIYNNFGTDTLGQDKIINHMTLTNVLIAGNTAGSGGGIYCGNWTANTGTKPGQGIHIWMNNVTIAKNTATSGAGMYLANNLYDMNKITVKANNSIIWGDAAVYNGGVTNIIHNDLQSRITLKNSLAWAAGSLYDGGSNKTASSFTGTYGPFAGANNYAIGSGAGTNDLVDVGNSDYPDSVDDLLPATALDGLSRSGDFNALITTHVIIPGWLNKDVTAALGDRLHTTNPGTVGDIYSVSVSDTPPSTASADKNRKNRTIDVGAYEKQ